MDRAERVSVGVAAALVATAAAAWILEAPPPVALDPDAPTLEPERLPPERPLPDAPPVSGERTLLPSGLEITEVRVGPGLPLRPWDIAVVELTVWSTRDGRLVDSTFYGPGPTRLWIVPGQSGALWEEGLDWLRVGGERLLVAPPGLDRGSPGSIVLVELVGILDPPRPPPPVPLRELAGFGIADLVVGSGAALADGAEAILDYSVWATGPTRVDGSSPGSEEPVDSSLLRVSPLTLRIGRDPLAWGPALDGMHAGGRRLVRVPPDLAFPADRRPPDLPAGEALLVEVRLHAVK